MRLILQGLLAVIVIIMTCGITILDRYKDFIVGPDERVIVDYPQFPWTAIGKIEVYAGSNNRQFDHYCTGTLVGERLILTSADCLYIRDSGTLGRSFVFSTDYRRGKPGFISEVIHVYVPDYYTYSAYPRRLIWNKYNWAVAVLADPIGQQAGFFEVIDVSHLNLKWPRAGFNTGGYEQKDKPRLQAQLDCVIQETDAEQTLLYHVCNTVPGFAGMPLWFMWNGKPTVVGVNGMLALHQEVRDNKTETVPDYSVAASRDFVYKVFEYRTIYYGYTYEPTVESDAKREKEKEERRDHPFHKLLQQLH